jgi:hypothetical protein
VFGLPQPSVLVLWQHHELGDQPRSIKHRHQLLELYTGDRAAERLRSRLISGMRHGYLSDFVPCMHHLHDQVANPYTDTEPIAEPAANPRSVAFTFAFGFALTESIGGTWCDQRNAFTHCIARFLAARRHRRRRF